MALINFTESLVARCYPADLDEAYNVYLLASGTLAGHALYQDPTTGAYGLAQATASGVGGFRGVALETNVASGVISMLRRGIMAGYDLSGMNYDDRIYLSDTAGRFADTAGTITITVGRVVGMSDPGKTKVAYFDAEYASGDAG